VTILLLSSRKLQGIAKEQVQIDVFFHDDVPETEIFQLEKVFQSEPFVKSVKFVSSHAALMSMKDAIENDGIELIEGESPIPPSLSFHPTRAYANVDSLKALKTRLESKYDIVDDFDYNERIIQQSNEGVKNLVFIISIIGILLFFVAIALINNTIRLSLYSKRFLIKTMQMVGATSGFIRKPFIFQSFMQGLISSLIAMVLLLGIVLAFTNLIPDVRLIIDNNLIIITFTLILVIGLMATMVSTWFAMNKYFRLKLDDLY
jgi:cell division transport system permease protein